METSKYEKRRGRAKKRVEALRTAGLPLDSTEFIANMSNVSPSPSSSISEGLDLFPDSPLHRYLSTANSRAFWSVGRAATAIRWATVSVVCFGFRVLNIAHNCCYLE